MHLRLNGDASGAAYTSMASDLNGVVPSYSSSGSSSSIKIGFATAAGLILSGAVGSGSTTITDYSKSNRRKTVLSSSFAQGSDPIGGIGPYMTQAAGEWHNNTAVTSLTVFPSAGSFTALTEFSLYGTL